MLQLFSQMLKLPVRIFVYSMEMFVKTMQGLQEMAYESIDMMADGVAHVPGDTLDSRSGLTHETTASGSTQTPGDALGGEGGLTHETTGLMTSGTIGDRVITTHKERQIMDKDMHDDMLKLVRYKVLFVRREYELAFREKEDLVSDNMDGSAFTAWKTAEFIQELGREELPVPPKWRVKNYPPAEFVKDGKLIGLPDEDKKYLRVYYEVLERYPREEFKYEEQQIRVLEQIRDKISS
jgi:hypothetical protein